MFEGETIQLADFLKYPEGTVFSFVRKLHSPSVLMVKVSSDRGILHYRPMVASGSHETLGRDASPSAAWGAEVGPDQSVVTMSSWQHTASWVTVYSKDELLTILDDLMTGLRAARRAEDRR